MVVLVDTVSVNQVRPRHPEKVNRPDALSPPKPDWIRVRAPNTRGYADTRKIVKENGLVTVCEEAGCPNIGECWEKKHATFMIMGDTCTRACAFCNVKTGMPRAVDPLEPEHVAVAAAELGLTHIVVTSVDRDDLPDGGASQFVKVIEALRRETPDTTIEILADPSIGSKTNDKIVYEVHKSWSIHVDSWTNPPRPGLAVLRYEDMLNNPIKAFGGLSQFLGLNPPRKRLERAIERASFKTLRRQEDEQGFKEKSPFAQKFFRDGRAGQWRELLTPAQIDKVAGAHKEQMQRFGYWPLR